MSREFAPVSPAIWDSPRFRSLDSDGRVLMFYFISGPHQNIAGCARVKEGYALADLGWNTDQFQGALSKIVDADLVLYDAATEEAYVRNWFCHKGNIPTNQNHAKGAKNVIAKIDSDNIRAQVEADFKSTEWGARISALQADPSSDPIVVTDAFMRSKIYQSGRG